jgi:hypothetical protein
MTRSARLIAPLALALAATALAPVAGATVLGPNTGVTAVRTGDTVDVAFTPAALAQSGLLAGRAVTLSCDVAATTTSLQFKRDSASGGDLAFGQGTVGADGHARVRLDGAGDKPGAADYCEVGRVRHIAKHSSTEATVARVPLTPAGATYVDETERATALRRLLEKAHAATGYQPASALGAGVVALDSPDATPPAGQQGYWTDGTHAAVVTLSAAGRRLLIQDLGGFVVRSNVYDQMDPFGFDDFDASKVATTTTPSEAKKTGSPDADRKPSPYRGNEALMPADGIRATVSGRRVTMRFTGRAAKTFRALHGRRLTVFCEAVPRPTLFPALLPEAVSAASGATAGVGVARVPSHGDAITLTLRGGTGDVCFAIDDLQPVATAGGTKAGRAWIQDLAALMVLFTGDDLDFAAPGGQRYLPTDQVVAKYRRKGFVAMSGPDGAVRPGRVGVWTDGAQQAAIAAVSASGRRFLIVDEGNGTGRTNILSAFSTLFLSASLGLAENSGSGELTGSFDGE